MTDFKVSSVAEKKRFDGKQGGTFIVYTVTLNDGSVDHSGVELVQKDSTPAPTVGQTVTGNIETTQYGPKFKREQQGRPGGWKKDPETEARISRMHAQEMALRYAHVTGETITLDTLPTLITWFFDDANSAKPPKAPLPRRDPERVGGSDIPTPIPTERAERIQAAISEAGLKVPQVRALLSDILGRNTNGMSKEGLRYQITQLSEPEAEKVEGWLSLGEPPPALDPVPFDVGSPA